MTDEVPGGSEGQEGVFKDYLSRHKYSQIVPRLVGGNTIEVIERPWDDPTVILVVSGKKEEAEALNSLFLPRRFTAIWHLDSKDIEVIWTAYKLSPDQQEVAGRTFVFTYQKREYKCEFGASSDRLLTLAGMFQPDSNPSDTYFRNLVSFSTFIKADSGDAIGSSVDTPKSFWIRNVDLSEKEVVPLIERLNFYLSYYDERSPIIRVHGEGAEFAHQRTRYPVGAFPANIVSRELDVNLISFWQAARSENEILQFILYYRIIEYAGYHYVDVEAREKILRVLRDPARGHDGTKALSAILKALDGSSGGGDERFVSILERHVDPETVWREVDLNRSTFSKEQKFDGDFQLDALIGKKELFPAFETGGMIRFAAALRRIRNVLAHGRDQKTGTVITPSLRNLRMLRPWVAAIAAAAGEIVMYEPAS
jgi:hypothetical protein